MPRAVRVLLWLLLIFLIYSIFTSPENAADLVVGGVNGIGRGFGAVFTFFDAVLGRLGGTGAQATGLRI